MNNSRFKFRAWDKQAKSMINDPIFHEFTDINDQFDDDDFIFMQFTGLIDKEGKEIYEGDIVECDMSYKGGSLPHMGEIVYVDRFGAFATKNEAGETLLHNHLLNTFNVIGNIYENPELLEEGSQE